MLEIFQVFSCGRKFIVFKINIFILNNNMVLETNCLSRSLNWFTNLILIRAHSFKFGQNISIQLLSQLYLILESQLWFLFWSIILKNFSGRIIGGASSIDVTVCILDRINDIITILEFIVLCVVINGIAILNLPIPHLLLHHLILNLYHILIISSQFGLDRLHFLLGQIDVVLSCF